MDAPLKETWHNYKIKNCLEISQVRLNHIHSYLNISQAVDGCLCQKAHFLVVFWGNWRFTCDSSNYWEIFDKLLGTFFRFLRKWTDCKYTSLPHFFLVPISRFSNLVSKFASYFRYPVLWVDCSGFTVFTYSTIICKPWFHEIFLKVWVFELKSKSDKQYEAIVKGTSTSDHHLKL